MATVRYIVTNVDDSIAFYAGHLGFTVRQQFGPAMAILERDGLTLWLAGPAASASRPMPGGAVPAPGGWNRFVIEVSDMEGLMTSMAAAGVRFRSPIVTGPGGRQVLCDDPSGNPIELFEPAGGR